MTNPYSEEETEKLEEAETLLSTIRELKSHTFVFRVKIWLTRRKLHKLDGEYFKPRVQKILKDRNIKKMDYRFYHFQAFRLLTEDEN